LREVEPARAESVKLTDLEGFCAGEYPRLVGALTLYCGVRATAEELAQEALIRVCQHWERVRRLENPGAWAHRVAMNLANSHLRRLAAERRARARLATLAESQRFTYEVVEPSVDGLRTAIGALPRKQRRALILRYYVGLSVAEVATEMSCPEGTVKRLTHEATKALRRDVPRIARWEASNEV
jgi:RNA polymerase sigma factor (sigma-70 family)